ncbi:hypothetical protein K435DRAFT_921571, partial [Dendrothele bispora CBS 962.96]
DQARRSCTPGTRVQILNDIDRWADNLQANAPSGYWICGMAGTGKSTIAKSVCMSLKDKEHLAAAFFCSRQMEDCRDYRQIIPTIAYQLSRYSCRFAEVLQIQLEKEQDLATKECSEQLNKLVANPWKEAKRAGEFDTFTPVIVIDALDECEEIDELLKILVPAIQKQMFMGLKFFFTSRPEQHVSLHMGPSGQVDKFELHNVEEEVVKEDILKFLKAELINWSIPEKDMQIIVQKSGKLFIYASTIVRYITTSPGHKQQRLSKVINSAHHPDKQETKHLDALYAEIINTAFSSDSLEREEIMQCLTIVYTSILSGRPMSCTLISKLLGPEL